jgi:hypothetical protein
MPVQNLDVTEYFCVEIWNRHIRINLNIRHYFMLP